MTEEKKRKCLLCRNTEYGHYRVGIIYCTECGLVYYDPVFEGLGDLE